MDVGGRDDRSLVDLYEGVRTEHARLERDALGALEFARVQEVLRRHLPAPPVVVRDVGGGTGVHARWLADDGYEVELLEPVPRHVEQATEDAAREPTFGVRCGDARDLPWPDGSSDVVLLFGPLYHLVDGPDRARVLAQARRVLRAGGLLAAQCINISAGLLDFANRGVLAEHGPPPGTEETLRTGVSGWPDFQPAYLHNPTAFADEIARAGFAIIECVGVEGPGCIVPNLETHWQDTTRREHLLRSARVAETNPTLNLLSHHTIAIARPS